MAKTKALKLLLGRNKPRPLGRKRPVKRLTGPTSKAKQLSTRVEKFGGTAQRVDSPKLTKSSTPKAITGPTAKKTAKTRTRKVAAGVAAIGAAALTATALQEDKKKPATASKPTTKKASVRKASARKAAVKKTSQKTATTKRAATKRSAQTKVPKKRVAQTTKRKSVAVQEGPSRPPVVAKKRKKRKSTAFENFERVTRDVGG